MIPDEAEFTPPSRSAQLRSNPFWVAVFVVWIVMLIVGFTLALALGIWFLIGAF
jgi:hypothetical protein